MKAEIVDGYMQVAFDSNDNEELKTYPDAIIRAVFDSFSNNSNSLTIQQNEQMKQMMILSCTIPQMIEILKKYVADYHAEIVFMGENKASNTIVTAVRTDKEEKSGIYEVQEDYSLMYSEMNKNPDIYLMYEYSDKV